MVGEWISAPEAAKRFNLPISVVRRARDEGLVSVRRLPRSRPQVWSLDLMAITAWAVTPANQPGEGERS